MGKSNQGSVAGSLAAYRLMYRAQEAKTKVVKTESQKNQDEFSRIKREHDAEFIQVRRPATEYEQAINGLDSVVEEIPRVAFEQKMGIPATKAIWQKPISEIYKMPQTPLMIDMMSALPHTADGTSLTEDESAQAARQAGNTVCEQLDSESRDKVAAYVIVHFQADPRVDIRSVATWQRAVQRLQELGCLGQTQERTQPPTAEPSADSLKTAAEDDWYYNRLNPLWDAFLDHLAQKFNFYPNENQKRAFLDFVETHGLSVLDCFDESGSDLQTTANIPAASASFSRISPALFVNINNGTCGMRIFNARAASSPFITGMDRSRIMRLGFSSLAFCTPSAPSAASDTSKCSASNTARSMRLMIA
jgi:hypothetical protein